MQSVKEQLIIVFLLIIAPIWTPILQGHVLDTHKLEVLSNSYFYLFITKHNFIQVVFILELVLISVTVLVIFLVIAIIVAVIILRRFESICYKKY